MKPSEIREKTATELTKLKASLREELFHLRLKKATGQLEKIHRVGLIRRDLARVMSVENEKTKEKAKK